MIGAPNSLNLNYKVRVMKEEPGPSVSEEILSWYHKINFKLGDVTKPHCLSAVSEQGHYKHCVTWPGYFATPCNHCDVTAGLVSLKYIDIFDKKMLQNIQLFKVNFNRKTLRTHCLYLNKANLRDLIAATGLVVLLKLDLNRNFFSPCDLEIWWMTLKK